MADQFQVDNSDLKQLIKFYKEAPQKFRFVSAEVLNSMAFHDKKMSMRNLGQKMIIRNPALLKKVMKVEKAKGIHRIEAQFAVSGSIKTARHDAFEHVEDGSQTRATQFMKMGRSGGTDAGKGIKAAKTGEAQTFPSDFRLKGSGDQRTALYLQSISQDSTRRRKTFMMNHKYKRMPPGIYKFIGGRVGKYQGRRTLVGAVPVRVSIPADRSESRFRPKAIHWKEKATNSINEQLLKKFWADNAERNLRKLAKKLGLT